MFIERILHGLRSYGCSDHDPQMESRKFSEYGGREGRMDYWLVLEPRNLLVLKIVRRTSAMTSSEMEPTGDVAHPRTCSR